jgi:pimeloyl-ACP methyl ester carboxylesterase
LQLLPQLGHCPHDERPALFNRTLLQWLERQAST